MYNDWNRCFIQTYSHV